MRKKIIINIDGPRAIGKSTQIHFLAKALRDLGNKVITNVNDKEDYTTKIVSAKKAFESNETDIVINKHSFMRPIVEDLVDEMSNRQVTNKHGKLIELSQSTRQEYDIVSILLVTDDLAALQQRIVKYNKMTGASISLINLEREKKIMQEMILFEKHLMTVNSDTKVLNISPSSPVLEIHKFLLDQVTSLI